MLTTRNGSTDGQVLSGGGYRLTVLNWQSSGVSSGGGYILHSPESPTLTGSGCCCMYLPCVLK